MDIVSLRGGVPGQLPQVRGHFWEVVMELFSNVRLVEGVRLHEAFGGGDGARGTGGKVG